jgi:hypothetical protein
MSSPSIIPTALDEPRKASRLPDMPVISVTAILLLSQYGIYDIPLYSFRASPLIDLSKAGLIQNVIFVSDFHRIRFGWG